MGGPQYADVLLGDQPPDVTEDIGAGLDVEADGCLVEQQQARAMQQRAGDFQPSHLAAREVAHLAAGAVGKVDAREHFTGAQACLARVDAVQGGMIQQVLHDREIEVERARLEHHAQQPQGFAGRKANVVAEDADAPGLDAEQPRDQREQCAFTRTVEAEQRREACRHGCAIVMPQGSSPTWMVLITFCATTSMIEMSLDTPLVTSRYFSSGVNAMCQTRWPTRRYLVT